FPPQFAQRLWNGCIAYPLQPRLLARFDWPRRLRAMYERLDVQQTIYQADGSRARRAALSMQHRTSGTFGAKRTLTEPRLKYLMHLKRIGQNRRDGAPLFDFSNYDLTPQENLRCPPGRVELTLASNLARFPRPPS